MALPAWSRALSAALAASLVAALVSASAAFSTLVSLAVASSFWLWHAARPSARTATVTAIFFMIVPLLQMPPKTGHRLDLSHKTNRSARAHIVESIATQLP